MEERQLQYHHLLKNNIYLERFPYIHSTNQNIWSKPGSNWNTGNTSNHLYSGIYTR